MPDNEKPTMWNGGTTFAEEEQTNYNKMIRESEDYLDGVDIETNEEFNPRDTINKNMDKPAKISGGDPKNRYRRPEGNNER
tara:strand:- start:1510 stop:1752 length:243 start_codon:yes stop_codon:yes gene_type:complete